MPIATHPCVEFDVGEQMQLHDDVPLQTVGSGWQPICVAPPAPGVEL
jgi:hypothetical protein